MTSLLTWIWQGLALTLGVAAFLRLRRPFGAGARLALWWATLAAVFVLPVAAEIAGRLDAMPPAGGAGREQAAAGAFAPVALPAPSDWLVAVAIGAWLGYLLVTLVKLVRAGLHLGWLKRRAMPVDAAREARLPMWTSVRATGRRVALCETEDLAVPAALGLGRPTILLPRAIVGGLSDADLDQIVLHEYSHLRRRDDWSRALQALAKALAGFHPAVWWIGGQIDLEREAASDEFVVRQTGSARRYAACLARTAELVADAARSGVDTAHMLAPAASGSRRQLTLRVKRLLDEPPRPRRATSSSTALATGVLGLTAGVALLANADPIVIFTGHATAVSRPAPPAAPPTQTWRATTAVPAIEPVAFASPAASLPPDPPARDPGPAPAVDLHASGRRVGPSDFAMPGSALPPSPPPPSARALEARSLTAVVLAADPGPAAGTSLEGQSTDRSPWADVADAGTSVGLGARKAGVATAGFFTRIGRSITGVF
jgi:beta-lactamase regulating signal transducer with metallopeptidase domain